MVRRIGGSRWKNIVSTLKDLQGMCNGGVGEPQAYGDNWKIIDKNGWWRTTEYYYSTKGKILCWSDILNDSNKISRN